MKSNKKEQGQRFSKWDTYFVFPLYSFGLSVVWVAGFLLGRYRDDEKKKEKKS